MKAYFFAILIFLSFNQVSIGQEGFGIGASALYNANNGYLGTGARLFIPVREKLYAVPYVYHYFTNSETSGGISALVPFYKTRSFSFYAIVSGTFKGSVKVSATVNDSTQAGSGSKSLKADGEAGVGVLIGPGCFKGFVEPRYAVLSEEVLLRVGIAYFFNCKTKRRNNKRGKGRSYKRAKAGKGALNRGKPAVCPAYEW